MNTVLKTKQQNQPLAIAQKAAGTTADSSQKDSSEPVINSKSNIRLVTKRGGKAAQLMLFGSRPSTFPMAPGLKPLCRIQVSSTLALFNVFSSIGQGTMTYVADPTGNATNALQVFQWSTRFVGFQQYRIVRTRWIITPLRSTGLASEQSTALAGYAIAYIDDNPQAGAPSQAVALASMPIRRCIFNSESIHEIDYTTNEPGDMNLSNINTPPTHIESNSVLLGQHCLQLYTDDGFFGLDTRFAAASIPVLGVQAIYDVEFFGIGGS